MTPNQSIDMHVQKAKPIVLCLGESELLFRLSYGSVRGIKKRYGVKKWSQVIEQMQEEEDPIPLLYQCLVEPGSKPETWVRIADRHADFTEDDFADLIAWADTPTLTGVLQSMLTDMAPEPRPTEPEAGKVIQMPTIPTGPDSGDSAASDSV